jgi:SET domain-containing protein
MIEVRFVEGKGRGVFARRFIPIETEIERVPVLVVDDELVHTELFDYLFEWGEDTLALAMGYGSIYNHSYNPNARYDDDQPMIKTFTAIRHIFQGEEITVNYNGEPHLMDPVEFDVVD